MHGCGPAKLLQRDTMPRAYYIIMLGRWALNNLGIDKLLHANPPFFPGYCRAEHYFIQAWR